MKGSPGRVDFWLKAALGLCQVLLMAILSATWAEVRSLKQDIKIAGEHHSSLAQRVSTIEGRMYRSPAMSAPHAVK